jgi:hypothetical protein
LPAAFGFSRALDAVALATQCRRPLLVALGVGAAVGVACYLSGPVGTSVACGAVGFLGSLAASAWSRVRRFVPMMAMDDG